MSLHPPKRTRLFEIVRSSGLKQSQLSRLTGLSQDRISRLCRGKMTATPAELRQLAQALSVPVEQLADPLAALPEEEARAQRAAAWLASEDGLYCLRGLFRAVLAE